MIRSSSTFEFVLNKKSNALLLLFFCFLGCVFPSYGQTPVPPSNDPPAEVRPEAEQVQLFKDLEFFKSVEDDAPFQFRGQKGISQKREAAAEDEFKAWCYVLTHASKQPSERLAKYSTKNVPFANLFHPIRQDYLRELLHFEGKLTLILPLKTPDVLKKDLKTEELYEAWIYPKGQSELICLVVSELPPGVKQGESLNRWVAFDGYFFKLWHYESRQEKSPGHNQWRKAPLFLGKTFEDLGEPASNAQPYSSSMLATIVVAMIILVGAVLVLGWWFKRGDRSIKQVNKQVLEQQTIAQTSWLNEHTDNQQNN